MYRIFILEKLIQIEEKILWYEFEVKKDIQIKMRVIKKGDW